MNPKYREYFRARLCDKGETLKQYRKLFDTSRTPEEKRQEFNAKRKDLLKELMKREGFESEEECKCMLNYPGICDMTSGITIDHIIPLSSNKLNKEINNAKGTNGKKAETESFGSNNIENLIICCKKCNREKFNAILERDMMKKVLERKARLEKSVKR